MSKNLKKDRKSIEQTRYFKFKIGSIFIASFLLVTSISGCTNKASDEKFATNSSAIQTTVSIETKEIIEFDASVYSPNYPEQFGKNSQQISENSQTLELEENHNGISKDYLNEHEIETIRPVTLDHSMENLIIEISPRVELLSGVLSQTSWMNNAGPYGKGNKYYQELKQLFSQFKDENAIRIAEKLTKEGFVYDAPLGFILSLGELPWLYKDGRYDSDLVSRAPNSNILDAFRNSLIAISDKAEFINFFDDHRSDYLQYLQDTFPTNEAEKIINWMNDFYGWSADEFHIVLAPAMFPGGGYGVSHTKPNGDSIIYQIIRENGCSEETPYFGISDGTGEFESLILHEWSHSFVNPSIEVYQEKLNHDDLCKLYRKVQRQMEQISYGSVSTFFNEQIIRAVECVAYEQVFGGKIDDRIKNEEKYGFYLTSFTVDELKYYQEHRDVFPTFKEFAPYLLDQYRSYN